MPIETNVTMVPSNEEEHEFYDIYIDRDTGNYHLDFIFPAHMVQAVKDNCRRDDPKDRPDMEYWDLMFSAINNGIISIITRAYNSSTAKGDHAKNGIASAMRFALSLFDKIDKSKVN